MSEYKNKAFTLRINNDIMKQVRQIAKMEDRTINKQIERMIKEYLKNHYSSDVNDNIVSINNNNNPNINS